MNYKLKKIDIIIVVILIIIAGIVLFRAGYVEPPQQLRTPEIRILQDDVNKTLKIVHTESSDILWFHITIKGDCNKSGLSKYVVEGQELTECRETIILIYEPTNEKIGEWTFTPKEELPDSIITSLDRSVSPEDEGPHFNKKIIGKEFFREWWYYTVIFDEDSDLAGWTLTISFNHMARNDLFISKPDLLIVLLHSPDGKEYGGILQKERYLGILNDPSLQASLSYDFSNFEVKFDNSFIQGRAPKWHVYIEGDEIDNQHSINIDLRFFAPNSAIWLHKNRPIEKSNGKIGSYVFLECEVEGVIELDGMNFEVKGIGHHEHTWAGGILVKSVIRGWDWSHIVLDNGWTLHYSTYYLTPQIKSTKVIRGNPFARVLITTDKGNKITILDDIDINIVSSDNIYLLLNVPEETLITGRTSLSQFFLGNNNLNLNLDITADHTYDQSWKIPYVGMKIGRCSVTGKISWIDDDGSHELDLSGVGTIWNMRH